MSGVINRGSFPRALLAGVNQWFGDTYKACDPIWSKIYEKNSSTKPYELDVMAEGFGLVSQKNEGDDIQFDTRKQGFSPKYLHSSFAKGFIVTREALDDEQYSLFTAGAKYLARSFYVTKEIEGAKPFNYAFSTTSAMTGGDGIAMCSTAHIKGPSGGTYSNRLAIDADFSEASLEDMLKLIKRATDSRGKNINLSAVRLIGHADQVFEFNRVLNSALQNDTANNATNSVRDMRMIRDGFVVSPYLSLEPDAWWLQTDCPEGFKYFERTKLEYGQDESFISMNARYRAFERYSFGYSDPRCVYGSAGA